jgi:hypothetical protein
MRLLQIHRELKGMKQERVAMGLAPLEEDAKLMPVHCTSCGHVYTLEEVLTRFQGNLKVKVVPLPPEREVSIFGRQNENVHCTTCVNVETMKMVLMRSPGHMRIEIVPLTALVGVQTADSVGTTKAGRYVPPPAVRPHE